MMFLQGKAGAYWSKYACPIAFWIEKPLNIVIRTTVVVVDAYHTYESEEALCIRIRIWIDGDHGIRRLDEVVAGSMPFAGVVGRKPDLIDDLNERSDFWIKTCEIR